MTTSLVERITTSVKTTTNLAETTTSQAEMTTTISRDKLPVLDHFRFRFGSRDRRHLEQRIFNDHRNK